MKAYNDLKEIYTGKRALYNHITFFSLLGIMVIFLNNLFAVWGSSLYIDLFAVPPSSTMGLWVALLGGFLIAVYLFGYSYQYISRQSEHKEAGTDIPCRYDSPCRNMQDLQGQ